MADVPHLERMGRELKCPICLSLLCSAVSLTCNHIFCNSCIEKSMKSASNCPVCKIPFRRREVRPAPHMDSLVNIYKSMEIASGVNIFVTQTALTNKLSDAEDDPTGARINEGEENAIICSKTPDQENPRRFKGKGSRRLSKISLRSPDINRTKPSFPTKKRVQVAQYSPPDTPKQPEFENEMDEDTRAVLQNCSPKLKNKFAVNEHGEPVFSPFFWLKDEEDAEQSTQQTNVDPSIGTPPDAPCFSDIKDSDDDISDNMTPKTKSYPAFGDTNMFDSEIFEWTQRACSPELCSSPVQIEAEETDIYDGTDKRKGQTASQDTTKLEELRDEGSMKFSEKTEMDLCTLFSSKLEDGDNDGVAKFKRRGRKGYQNPKKKGQKRTVGELSHTAMENDIQEDSIKNGVSNSKKRIHKIVKVGLDTNAMETKPGNASSSCLGKQSMFQDDKPSVDDLPPSLDQKEDNSGCHNLGIRSGKVTIQQETDCIRRSKSQKLNFAVTNRSRTENNKVVSSQADSKSFCLDSDDKVSDICMTARKKSGKSIIRSKNCNKNQRCSKKVKFSTDEVSNAILAKKTLPIGIECDPNVVDSLKVVDDPTGGILEKCDTINKKIQCAFCQSAEDSEALGRMAHYYNGMSVSADHNAGLNIIHAHRNCAEWAPNVYFEDGIAINLESEIARSRRIKCCCCGIKGAALGCYEKSCRKSFHFSCAHLTPECRWDEDNFVMLCPLHASSKLPNELARSQGEQKKKSDRMRQSQSPRPQVVVRQYNKTSWQWNAHGLSEKPVLSCSALTNEEKETVSEFGRLSGATVLKTWDSSITHVIASTDENGSGRRTLKFLMGILEGKWILSIEWVMACMKALKPVDEHSYEIAVDIHGIRDGPRLGRLRLLNKQPKLLSGYNFYFIGDFLPSYKGYLHDLVVAAGGTVLHRKPISRDQEALLSGSFTSTFIIYSLELPDRCDPSKVNEIVERRCADAEALACATGARVVSNLWVLNSIASCQLQHQFD